GDVLSSHRTRGKHNPRFPHGLRDRGYKLGRPPPGGRRFVEGLPSPGPASLISGRSAVVGRSPASDSDRDRPSLPVIAILWPIGSKSGSLSTSRFARNRAPARPASPKYRSANDSKLSPSTIRWLLCCRESAGGVKVRGRAERVVSSLCRGCQFNS